MVIRMTLLTLATGLFITIWTVDRPALEERPVVARRPEAAVPLADIPVAVTVADCLQQRVEYQRPDITPGVTASPFGWDCFPDYTPSRPLAESQPAREEPADIDLLQQARTLADREAVRTVLMWLGVVLQNDREVADVRPVAAPRPAVAEQYTDAACDCETPLPRDIAPGEYRIVDTRGNVTHRTFTAADLAYLGVDDSTPAHDLYVVAENGRRWYYIRVESKPVERIVVSPADKRQSRIDREQARAAVARFFGWFGTTLELNAERMHSASSRKLHDVRREAGAFIRELIDGSSGAIAESIDATLKRINRAKRMAAEPRGGRRL